MSVVGVPDNAADTPATGPAATPQLRTILLTDLVGSTELVEKIGDGAAAELFRAHDRLVLQLQERWRGRLIDRSDGMLLLFERPIDGLGFALDYVRGLREVGAPHKVDLKARAGMHVGEVLTWRNSPEAVRVGAKPVEVEGLAKPLAARLLGMARPGQVLLSSVAEPLARRSARELGERGLHLAWKSWGRWRLKGFPSAQEVFEAGEPGIAPLRRPVHGPKAWRDLPVWRRPTALAAQAVVVLAIAAATWLFTRPQPAIAFGERDWVVLADVRNLTGEPLLDDSLELAFRVSLEQSRHVNVLGDMKVRDTIARMQLQPGAPLDRATASEVAVRTGARAVILPTVANVGGRLRVSAEVIEPDKQTTVHTEFADARSTDAALASIDQVTMSLRARLGEAVAAIERDHAPLPEVSTSSLDALKAYAQGKEAFAQGEWRDAIALYEAALAIDPQFALAHLAISQVHVALSDRPSALPHLDAALALRDRMPPRERLYLDGWEAELRAPGSALSRWQALATVYPDYVAGQANAAWQLFQLNRLDDAWAHAQRAAQPPAPFTWRQHDLLGRIRISQGRIAEAETHLDRAESQQPGTSHRRRAFVLAVQERHDDALQVIGAIPASGHTVDDGLRSFDRVALSADVADWEEARRATAHRHVLDDPLLAFQLELAEASIVLVTDPPAFTEEYARQLVERALRVRTSVQHPDTNVAGVVLAAGWLAHRAGHIAPARLAREGLASWGTELRGTVAEKMWLLLESNDPLLEGRPDRAMGMLGPQLDGAELVQARVAMLKALRAAGSLPAAREQARWLASNRGKAYVEANASQVLQTLNVLDTRLAVLQLAELYAATGDAAQAGEALQEFLSVWPKERLSPHLRRRVDSISPASK